MSERKNTLKYSPALFYVCEICTLKEFVRILHKLKILQNYKLQQHNNKNLIEKVTEPNLENSLKKSFFYPVK